VLALLSAAPAWAQNDPTLRIGLREDPDLLDPTLGSSYVGRIVYAAMCDKLFDIDAKLNIVPQLATGSDYEDPTHLVVHLRPHVTFQDGTPFDAGAVKFKIDRDRTIKGSMRAGEVNTIASVEVIDPLTVRLVLKTPSSPLLAVMTDRAGIMISPAAVQKAGADFGLHPVCAGPFAFDSRVAQDHIVLRRFPGYWNAGAIHFDRVIYLPIPNSSVRLANLQAGSLDLVEYIVPTDIAAAQADPHLKLAIGDGLAYYGVTFNTDNGPKAQTPAGQSATVRRAFELSIDRQALIQTVYNGLYTPTAQANPPDSPFYVPSVVPPPRDIAQAKALLREAGVRLPVPVTLMLSNNPDLQQVGEVIQSMAGEAGFDVRLRTVEFAASLQAGYAGDFEAYLIGWSGRADADANMWPFLHRTGTFNYGHYGNDDVDHWLDQARTITDIPQRRALYQQVWTQERRDMPLVYLWIQKNIVGMRKELNGFVQVPDGLIRLQNVTLGK
jgi:peptide/nickel transport system substrate-binding protein